MLVCAVCLCQIEEGVGTLRSITFILTRCVTPPSLRILGSPLVNCTFKKYSQKELTFVLSFVSCFVTGPENMFLFDVDLLSLQKVTPD